jgi:hypothetical protein
VDDRTWLIRSRFANSTSKPGISALLRSNADSLNSRMLEDPSYDQVVRWGNEGDSFVVLEVDTRHGILPRATDFNQCYRTKNSRNRSYPSISSIATLLVSSDN